MQTLLAASAVTFACGFTLLVIRRLSGPLSPTSWQRDAAWRQRVSSLGIGLCLLAAASAVGVLAYGELRLRSIVVAAPLAAFGISASGNGCAVHERWSVPLTPIGEHPPPRLSELLEGGPSDSRRDATPWEGRHRFWRALASDRTYRPRAMVSPHTPGEVTGSSREEPTPDAAPNSVKGRPCRERTHMSWPDCNHLVTRRPE